MSAKDSYKLRWLPIFLEAFFVVLGVVLALAANEWREHRRQRQHAAAALESIRDEIEVNRQAVRGALDYHLQLSDTLRGVIRQAAQHSTAAALAYPDARLFSKGYIAPAPLLTTAWQAANATEALSYMDYDDVLTLSRIYENQHSYEQQSQQAGELVYAKLFSEGHDGMRRNYANLSTMIATFWYRECQLLQDYGKALSQLDGTPPPDPGTLPPICQRVAYR